jgi:hypothetical protein
MVKVNRVFIMYYDEDLINKEAGTACNIQGIWFFLNVSTKIILVKKTEK